MKLRQNSGIKIPESRFPESQKQYPLKIQASHNPADSGNLLRRSEEHTSELQSH